MIYQRSGDATILRKPKIEIAHPMPIALINGTTATVAPAPSKNRRRLFDAVTVPALPGYRSSISTTMQFREAEMQKPMKNRKIRGPARLVRYSNVRPNPTTQRLPRTIVGTAASSRASSIEKLSDRSDESLQWIFQVLSHAGESWRRSSVPG